jgi:hypothetical protein
MSISLPGLPGPFLYSLVSYNITRNLKGSRGSSALERCEACGSVEWQTTIRQRPRLKVYTHPYLIPVERKVYILLENSPT